MQYSWTKFACGFAAGIAAIALSSISIDYWWMSVLLLLVSSVLMGQRPKAAPEPEPPFTSDLDEWRAIPRDFIKGLPSLAVSVVMGVGVVLAQEWIAERYPWIAQLPREMLWAVLLAAYWIPQVLASFRSGRHRLKRMVA